MNEASLLAASRRGAMIAGAGCGKTHVIAVAVAEHSVGRQLILTHTNAGVEALRSRLRKLQVPTKSFQISTIAGWALRLAKAFPKSADLPDPRPREDYAPVYLAAARLLAIRPIQEIVRASYSGVYVDEYQDCTEKQHQLVVALLELVPCRVLGDPLQSIFGFDRRERIINWEVDVRRCFTSLPGPSKPWRWVGHNEELGEWLQGVRSDLQNGKRISLCDAPINWIPSKDFVKRRDACASARTCGQDTFVVIRCLANQCHHLAKNLKGLYSCIEPVSSKDLFEFAERIESSTGFARATAVIAFAGKCMTTVASELKGVSAAFEKNRKPRTQKHAEVLDALLAIHSDCSVMRVETALLRIREMPKAILYRRELFDAMVQAVRELSGGNARTLADAAWGIRNRSRRSGRHLPRCAVGTPPLVKGLEFHHAIVFDDGYDSSNLYVALTRGAKSLTIVSEQPYLIPI